MRQAELMGSGALALAVAEAVAVAVVDDAHRLRPPLRPARRRILLVARAKCLLRKAHANACA